LRRTAQGAELAASRSFANEARPLPHLLGFACGLSLNDFGVRVRD
jgi:hypothetical protein